MTETKDIQDDLKESAHKIWLAGLGALSVAGDEGRKVFTGLVEKGETYESRGRDNLDEVRDRFEDAAEKTKDRVEDAAGKAKDRVEDAAGKAKDRVEEAAGKAKGRAESAWDKIEEKLDDAVTAALGRIGVPSRDEIATLTQRVEELTAVVEQLKPAKKTAAKTAKPAGK